MTEDEYRHFEVSTGRHGIFSRAATVKHKALFFTWIGIFGFSITGITGIYRGIEFFDLPPCVSITMIVISIAAFPVIYYIGIKGNDPRTFIDKVKGAFQPKTKPRKKPKVESKGTPTQPPAPEGEKTKYKPKFTIY
jgi:hypothetical protein